MLWVHRVHMVVDVGMDLIRKAQAGEAQALVRLVETYQAPVYALALAMMRDRTDAADMTQETFVRLLRSIRSYRGDGATFWSWVHRLSVNICLDALRRQQRTRVLPLVDAAADHDDRQVAEPASSDLWEQPEWRVQWQESADEICAALARLPGPQRRALTLHYFDGRPYDEIAATMGLPLNTVKSHILRGKERMARFLKVNGRRFYRGASGPRMDCAAAA
jgi:RNA polymerase sigma-70 factor, ECF subfamily